MKPKPLSEVFKGHKGIPTIMEQTFREYLRNKFAESYKGLDDDMPDHEADWFDGLDVEDVIDWGEEYAKAEYKRGVKHTMDIQYGEIGL